MATRTVVLALHVKSGLELQLTHDLPIEFPAEALSRIKGIKRVTLCNGKGLFTAVVEYKGDFERIYREYISSPAIQAFHYKVEKFFQDPPHSIQVSALPLAGDTLFWDGEKVKVPIG